MLKKIGDVAPCGGVRERHLPNDVRGSFGSYITRSIRVLREEHAVEVAALGLINAVGKEAATLHSVCGPQGEEFVLYSTNCTCFETQVLETTVVCGACLQFRREGPEKWLRKQHQPPAEQTNHKHYSTPALVGLIETKSSVSRKKGRRICCFRVRARNVCANCLLYVDSLAFAIMNDRMEKGTYTRRKMCLFTEELDCVSQDVLSAAAVSLVVSASWFVVFSLAQIRKIQHCGKEKRDMRRQLHRAKLEKCREGNIHIAKDNPQGQQLFDVLQSDDVQAEFAKLPDDSLARAVLEVNPSLTGSRRCWRLVS